MTIIGDSFVRVGKSNGVAIDEYNGKYSLMSVWENRDGELKPNWSYSIDRDGQDSKPGKMQPVKVYIGENPAEVLQTLILMLGGKGAEPDEDGDDIPF